MTSHARALFVILAAGCGSSGALPSSDGGGGSDDMTSSSACVWTEHTSPTGESNNGCALLARDASACYNARAAAGLDGFWLGFSCSVELTVDGDTVQLYSLSMPDYPSNYFPTSDPCYAAATNPNAIQNPNWLMSQPMTLTVPRTPSSATSTAMGVGAVGMALNGVAIFDDRAAMGDDIYTEAKTFDDCQGHPTPTSMYHYHAEPYAISYDDARFIGVMRDGYAVYGRRDADGSLPTLDADGGHTGVPPDGTVAVYHYHVNLQENATATASEWFLTTGTYHGAPGACAGCQ